MLNWFKRRDQPAEDEPAGVAGEAPEGPGPALERPREDDPTLEDAAGSASLDASLERTRSGFFGRVKRLFGAGSEIDDEFFDELEALLIQGDVGLATAEKLLANLRRQLAAQHITTAEEARLAFQDELAAFLEDDRRQLLLDRPLSLVLVIGVNGAGKTTSIAKLAKYLSGSGHRVLLAAGDTFRAAAIEQLQVWGSRVGVPVVSHQFGSDPGAVVFDALDAAEARKADVVIADTAGRLHTKFNLMEELKKISRVAARRLEGAPHEVLLVLDATTGQNAIAQAKQFDKTAGITGIVLTKLDSTAKGGVVFAIREELGLPIKFVGTGEGLDDLAPFDPDEFAAALFR
ncbi:MAG TPA: signal recognition particle-docking protein FtsY [Chloroflexota bacterium]|nr:signal recognition particle-docking protein FtsY [Chloroflexota bacterium]